MVIDASRFEELRALAALACAEGHLEEIIVPDHVAVNHLGKGHRPRVLVHLQEKFVHGLTFERKTILLPIPIAQAFSSLTSVGDALDGVLDGISHRRVPVHSRDGEELNVL